jgi:hypothetical protein
MRRIPPHTEQRYRSVFGCLGREKGETMISLAEQIRAAYVYTFELA